ncbi:hypothetical protein V3331_14410 [Gaopeijia maritima]|uniref:hypothetical protein n=1 Tax=Gaopeijia maritima TaxID=3119007 RepID=UPI00324E4C5F
MPTMILHCNYEELQALRSGAEAALSDDVPGECAIAAPSRVRSRVEALLPTLVGDLSIATLAEQEACEEAVRAILTCQKSEMDAAVLAAHPAAEIAVAAYFDYAHTRAVLGRLEEMGRHMRALIEVVTGGPASDEIALTFAFPD